MVNTVPRLNVRDSPSDFSSASTCSAMMLSRVNVKIVSMEREVFRASGIWTACGIWTDGCICKLQKEHSVSISTMQARVDLGAFICFHTVLIGCRVHECRAYGGAWNRRGDFHHVRPRQIEMDITIRVTITSTSCQGSRLIPQQLTAPSRFF